MRVSVTTTHGKNLDPAVGGYSILFITAGFKFPIFQYFGTDSR
jgi:hypothetical protein